MAYKGSENRPFSLFSLSHRGIKRKGTTSHRNPIAILRQPPARVARSGNYIFRRFVKLV